MRRHRLIIQSALAAAILSAAPSAYAATAAPRVGQALEISPAIQNLQSAPSTTQVIKIMIRNISPADQIVTPRVDDFQPDGETGLPKLLPEGGDPSRSIKQWVRMPAPMLLRARQTITLDIRTTIPADASPGTHYGAIRFTAAPPGVDGTGVSISTSIGSLVLLNVSGATSEKLSTASFIVSKGGKPGKFFEKAPLDFIERLRNEGNVSATPTGVIEIRDTFNKKIADVNVNLPPRIILPGSTRKFEQTLNKEQLGKRMLFGHYKARLVLNYGESKKVLSSTTTFWVVPYTLIAIVLGILLIIFGIIMFMRRYVDFELKKKPTKTRKKG